MKKQLTALAILAGLIAATPALADKPVLTKVNYETTVTCNKAAEATDDSDMVMVKCNPDDLKKYPFLADLTTDPTQKGSIYVFDITRIEDKNFNKPIYLLRMHNETIYTIWASAAGIMPNEDGNGAQRWMITGGTVSYTASCPKSFGFIVKGNEHDDYAEWVYDGKHINRIDGHNKLEDFSCN